MDNSERCALCGGVDDLGPVARWAVCGSCRGELEGWFGVLERKARVARLASARDAARVDPARHSGAAPYGYRAAGGGRLKPERRELEVCDWIVRQRERGFPWSVICGELERAGVEPPRASRWSVSTVRRIVERAGRVPAGAVVQSG